MIIDKIIKKLAQKVTPTGKYGRETLKGVFFTKNKAVATDSCKLVEITYHKEEEIEKDKMICKDDIKNNLIDIEELDELVVGKFPNYQQFFKKEGKYTDIGVDPQYLIDVMEVYKSSGITTVHMEIGGSLSPIHFSAGDVVNEIEIKAIIMPVKL